MPTDVASIPGSKWWTFDFHAHTPTSTDYRNRQNVAPMDWVLSYMRAGIDCVAVTDHNSAASLPLMRDAVLSLERSGHADYRPLVLFPGFELTVSGGFHILGIFDPATDHEAVAGVIGACGYQGTHGDSDAVTHQTVQKVLEIITDNGGIGIPAHVDDEKGLWGLQDAMTMGGILGLDCLYSVEKMDINTADPAHVVASGKELSYVVGSDSHGLDDSGSRYCWVKMAVPDKEGLRLALLDGDLSLHRHDSDVVQGDPNQIHSEKYIESVEISEAQFIGRGASYQQPLNPWMNSIIGGRGTGKSSLLEFIRIGCCRHSELDDYAKLADEFSKYMEVCPGRGRGGLCTTNTVFKVYYRSIGQLFRIEFAREGKAYSVYEMSEDGAWTSLEDQDIVSRFPVKVYSQKQIYQIAEHPQALLHIVDNSQVVDVVEWRARWEQADSELTVLSEQIRGLNVSLEAEGRLRGELADVGRKLLLFENDENAEILTAYQHSKKQLLEVSRWMEGFDEIPGIIKQAYDELDVQPFAGESFDEDHDREFLELATNFDEKASALKGGVLGLHESGELLLEELKEAVEKSGWKQLQERVAQQYDELVALLEEQGVENPDGYNDLVEAKNAIEDRLKRFEKLRADLEGLRHNQLELRGRVQGLREELTAKRREFLAGTIGDNEHVRITVTPYGDLGDAVTSIREVLRLEEGTFKERVYSEEGDEGLLNPLYDNEGEPVDDFLVKLEEMKELIKGIHIGDEDVVQDMNKHFVNRIQRMRPHDIIALECWYPEDALEVSYKSEARGGWESITQGSPGQKTAAILAFLLSYGDEPLLLDQPEDDLDNQLVFSLIVKQLIANKPRRQLIVVTHNPNIVVNGDSELVIALESNRGQTRAKSTGGLQESAVRADICKIMEGGEIAFEKRYRRIIQN